MNSQPDTRTPSDHPDADTVRALLGETAKALFDALPAGYGAILLALTPPGHTGDNLMVAATNMDDRTALAALRAFTAVKDKERAGGTPDQRPTIKEAWEEYRRENVHFRDDTPPHVEAIPGLIFYAGATAMFDLMWDVTKPGIPPEESEARISALQDELTRYSLGVEVETHQDPVNGAGHAEDDV